MAIVGVVVLLAIVGKCSGDEAPPAAEPPIGRGSLEDLKEKYPPIPANGIRIPPRSDLKNPDFDVGGHCLAEEKAGRGTFEDCIEVVGRELIAIGGPDRK